jgi:hypothetical protein
MKFPKTDVRYWQNVIYRTYNLDAEGKKVYCSDWTVRIAHEGRRETFPLGTPNRQVASGKAKEIYLFIVVNGLAAAITAFKKTLSAPAPLPSAI